MNEMSLIAEIGGLFALCGISCMRNFTPTFVLLVAARFLSQYGGCPDFLNQLAASIPAVMLSDGVLALFGAMAALEMAANWNMTLREYFADAGWEKYTKPFYAFAFSMVVGAPVGAAGLESVGVVQDAGSPHGDGNCRRCSVERHSGFGIFGNRAHVQFCRAGGFETIRQPLRPFLGEFCCARRQVDGLLFYIIFSSIPFVGALFIIPYVIAYRMKRGKFLK